jgi:hypothetical protein
MKKPLSLKKVSPLCLTCIKGIDSKFNIEETKLKGIYGKCSNCGKVCVTWEV